MALPGNDVGSILGSTATGAAAGSIVPGIGTAIGGIIGLGAGIYGAIKGGQERKRMEQYLNQQDAENKAWYNENAYSDYTQRTDTQNLIRSLRQNLDRQNKIASDTATVTGATPEQVAAQKERSNNVIADVHN